MALGAILLLLMMIASATDVLLRKFGPGSLQGVIEYSEVGLLALVYLGVPIAYRDDQHISTSIVTSRLSRRGRVWATWIKQILLLILVAGAALATLPPALESISVGERRFGGASVPIWPAKMLVPLTLSIMAAQVVSDLGTAMSRHEDDGSSVVR